MEIVEGKVKIMRGRADEGLKPYLFMKRMLDVGFSAVGLIILAIPMAVIAICIKIDSPGPVFFKQERLGLNGKPFMIYKFRTMRNDAEKGGPRWASKNDERCTKFGRRLRQSRLDELPQLLNILKGEMSFVGPRPERAYFYDKFVAYIPDFPKRLQVKPGLTGLAQVNGGYDLIPEEKLKYDMEYIRSRSIIMDFNCTIKTVRLVFTHEGAR